MRFIRMLLLPALALTAVSAHADPASVASLTNLLDKSKTCLLYTSPSPRD